MLIKSADDKQRDIDVLEGLLARPDIDATRRQIEVELRKIRAGAKGERDAAYEIDFDYSANPNRAVIHDLRLEVEGRVAQIDHLIIDRYLTLWVCESKQFSEGVSVDEHGEWEYYFGGRRYGMSSPIEQNRKHIAVLKEVFDQKLVEPKKRLGITIKPQFRSVILVSNGARISRPKSKAAAAAVDGLDTVLKVEKLQSLIEKYMDARSLVSISRVVSTETIVRLGNALVALHRPIVFDWAGKFGLAAHPPAPVPHPPQTRGSRLERVCESCGAGISYGVARYSAEHPGRFSGRILCMPCQQALRT